MKKKGGHNELGMQKVKRYPMLFPDVHRGDKILTQSPLPWEDSLMLGVLTVSSARFS